MPFASIIHITRYTDTVPIFNPYKMSMLYCKGLSVSVPTSLLLLSECNFRSFVSFPDRFHIIHHENGSVSG